MYQAVAIMNNEKFGRVKSRVSELAGRNRWSIQDLSDKANLSYQTAYSLYHDKTRRIDFDTMAKLCRAFDVQVNDLFYYVPSATKDGDS